MNALNIQRDEDHQAEVEDALDKQQVVSTAPEPSEMAKELADEIQGRFGALPGIEPGDVPAASRNVIDRMINGAFWSGSKGKLLLLNHNESLVQFREPESYKFLAKTFGAVVDGDAVEAAVAGAIGAQGLSAKDADNLRKAAKDAAAGVIMDHLKYHNQRESTEWRVDMFAQHSRMELLEDKVRIVLKHQPYAQQGVPDARIVEDYKKHFTRFDEFLTFLVMSRFAKDRKKSYLWFLAESNWGKGFLTSILDDIGAAVGTSTKEIEAMLEGKPVGRSPEDFKRSIVLIIDEFKAVKSEIKQLQSTISLAPKNQLTSTVEIFAKLFTSAESVSSLVTENGVEDQFANRMSIFDETGDITKRAVYKEVGNSRYFAAILAYTVDTLNRQIAEMQTEDRLDAEAGADEWLNGFITRNGLDTKFERFSDSLPYVAKSAIHWLLNGEGFKSGEIILHPEDNSRKYLTSAAKALDDYLNAHYDASQVTALRRKKPEILNLMSVDGKGCNPHRLGSKVIKALRLVDPESIEVPEPPADL